MRERAHPQARTAYAVTLVVSPRGQRGFPDPGSPARRLRDSVDQLPNDQDENARQGEDERRQQHLDAVLPNTVSTMTSARFVVRSATSATCSTSTVFVRVPSVMGVVCRQKGAGSCRPATPRAARMIATGTTVTRRPRGRAPRRPLQHARCHPSGSADGMRSAPTGAAPAPLSPPRPTADQPAGPVRQPAHSSTARMCWRSFPAMSGLTCQTGARISSTSALDTSGTGIFPMRGKA